VTNVKLHIEYEIPTTGVDIEMTDKAYATWERLGFPDWFIATYVDLAGDLEVFSVVEQ